MSPHNEGVATAAACVNHPRRDAIGVCVECRSQICSECVTKVDGINHCVRCYTEIAERGARDKERVDTVTPAALAWSAGLGMLGLLTLLTWAMLEVALPGGG